MRLMSASDDDEDLPRRFIDAVQQRELTRPSANAAPGSPSALP